MRVDEIAIAVPVRNEVARLPQLLRALAAQRSVPRFRLALFFDNCDDGSEHAVAELADTLPYTILTDCCRAGGGPNAGLARGRAMALAAAAVPRGVLLTTDADSRPAADWVAASLAALAHGEVAAGRIVREGRGSPVQDRLEAYYDRLHALRRTIDPVPWEAAASHHWTSGASLAIRTADYRAIGGFAPLANGEDAALGDAAARAGLRLRRDDAIVVTTSARRGGRARDGFAASLAAWDGASSAPAVAHPEDEAWRYAMHARARRLHGSDGVVTLAAPLRLAAAEVAQVAGECVNGEAFAARIVGAAPGGMRSVPLPRAEALLALLEQARLEGAA